ncbi:MAG: hypothetical protein GF393_00280 [Armatimonadia bacterium]|nr:hypothetical protein [Armatimonadia bacterium]
MGDDPRQFDTGPRMIDPRFGMGLALACMALAATQAWTVARHYLGAGHLDAQEPAARILFGVVFLLGAVGVTVALLEQRNATVTLDDDGIVVRSCCSRQRRVRWDEIEEVVFTRHDDEATDVPFHWLHVIAEDGSKVRLAGGPWQQTRAVQMLRHEVIDRLDLKEQATESTRWALLFKGMRNRWA